MKFSIGDFAAVEVALREAGRTVGEMCAAVPMAHSTWVRWKNGTTGGPTLKAWSAVERATATMIAQAPAPTDPTPTTPEEDAA